MTDRICFTQRMKNHFDLPSLLFIFNLKLKKKIEVICHNCTLF